MILGVCFHTTVVLNASGKIEMSIKLHVPWQQHIERPGAIPGGVGGPGGGAALASQLGTDA